MPSLTGLTAATKPAKPVEPATTRRLKRARRRAPPVRAAGRHVLGADGKQHLYLNVELPERQLPHGEQERRVAKHGLVCPVCRRAYAHVLSKPANRKGCDECRVEALAALANELQSAGISLGWGAVEIQQRPERISRVEIASMHVVDRRKR